MDLLELRKEIDRIDDQLIPLLMARMDVSEQVPWHSKQLTSTSTLGSVNGK